MSEETIRFVGELERLELKPGDRFVLHCDKPVTFDFAERIQKAWAQFVGGDPERCRLLILDRGMKLGAVSIGVDPAGEAGA